MIMWLLTVFGFHTDWWENAPYTIQTLTESTVDKRVYKHWYARNSFPKLYRRNSVAVTTTHRIWNYYLLRYFEERLHFNTFARNHGTSSTRMNMTWSNKTNLTHKAHSNIYHLLLAFSLSLLSLLLKYLIENMHYYTFQQYTKFQINEWAILYEKFKICRLPGANKNQKTQKIQFEDQWKCSKIIPKSLVSVRSDPVFWHLLAPWSKFTLSGFEKEKLKCS